MRSPLQSFLVKNVVLTTFFLIVVVIGTQGQDSAAYQFSSFITGPNIRKHLEVLAADSLEGRETAQPGMVKAAAYVAAKFSSFGIPPLTGNSYYQKIPLINFSNGTSDLEVAGKSITKGTEYFIADAPARVEVTDDEILFAGFGISDSASGWDDYRNVDAKQKIILILDGEPTDKNGNSVITKTKTFSSWSTDRALKIQLAKSKNPKAVYFVHNEYKKVYERFNRRLEHGKLGLDNESNAATIPVVYLDRSAGNQILAAAGKSCEGFEKTVGKKKKPSVQVIHVKSKLNIVLQPTSCTNVLGYVEGTDLKDEVIVISAHLDHLGKKDGKIYYGADDDGTGCSSILAMAEGFAKARSQGKGPRRSILFITFSGEEKGLLGSEYYVNNPVIPLEKTIANLNIDMIGRTDTIKRDSKHYTYLIGSDKLSTQLHTINETANGFCCQLNLDYKYNDPSDKLKLYYRSDHYNFARNNIPVIFYFTGLHEDYHKPTDTIDKIDFEKTAGIARLVFHTAWELANRTERIVVDANNNFR